MHTDLLAQIAPQRNTQYAALASALAPAELALSPIGSLIAGIEPLALGGQPYLKVGLTAPPDASQLAGCGALATISAFFNYFPELAGQTGPFLQPLELPLPWRLPPELIESRRYRGKTNEMFTHFLLNVAHFGSRYAETPWPRLRVADPLMGGGTTLLTGLALGASVAGIEKTPKDVQSTAVFLRNFCREAGIACRVDEERRSKRDRRWRFALGKEKRQRALLVHGDARQAEGHWEGFKHPHLIVTDLPYGIQHQGQLEELLQASLPVWARLLLPGGALAFAWESSRFPREHMIGLVEEQTDLRVHNQSPYAGLAHRVDRVIKRRDVVVAHKP